MSDIASDQMFRANMDGSDLVSLANATHEDVGMYCHFVVSSYNSSQAITQEENLYLANEISRY